MKKHILLLAVSCMMGGLLFAAAPQWNLMAIDLPRYSTENRQALEAQYRGMSNVHRAQVTTLERLTNEFSVNLKSAQQGSEPLSDEAKKALVLALGNRIRKTIFEVMVASIAKKAVTDQKAISVADKEAIEEDFNRTINTLCDGISYRIAAYQESLKIEEAAHLKWCRGLLHTSSTSLFSNNIGRYLAINMKAVEHGAAIILGAYTAHRQDLQAAYEGLSSRERGWIGKIVEGSKQTTDLYAGVLERKEPLTEESKTDESKKVLTRPMRTTFMPMAKAIRKVINEAFIASITPQNEADKNAIRTGFKEIMERLYKGIAYVAINQELQQLNQEQQQQGRSYRLNLEKGGDILRETTPRMFEKKFDKYISQFNQQQASKE